MRRKNVQKDIPFLYRYRRNSEEMENLIAENKLYFYPPTALNDPFDSKLRFSYNDCKEEDFRIINEMICRRRMPNSSEEEIQQEVERPRSNYMDPKWQYEFREFSKDLLQSSIDKIGLLSLTKKCDDILMWSHYADGHKGLCLEFSKQVIDANYYCGKVTYSNDYLSFKEFNKAMDATHEDNYIVMGECLLFRKSKHWDYECEWRIIYPDRIEPGGNRLLDYPPQMLTGIIFGCEMSEDDKKTIREMIRKRTHKTRLFQARKKDDEFALDIIEID
ncbi:MAG: DUF2971 domain-containing protein [Thermodesulfovibrionales bacterium]|jgi:hypothetical protein